MFIDLLRQELGESKEAVGEERFCCPFCGESKYKFYVNTSPSSKYYNLWYCFKCSEKGNPVSFTKEYYSVDYPEAADILSTFDYDVNEQTDSRTPEQYGNNLTEEEKLLLFISREGRPLEENETKIYKLPTPPTNTKSLIHNFNNPEAFPFFQYLNGRGITLEQIEKHRISYVIDGEVNLADGRKLRLVNHLVFFTIGKDGKAQYWNTRSIEPNPFIKSFNSPSRDNEYSKNNSIFNLNNAVNTTRIVVCEGFFDAATVGVSGVASFGKQLTDEQVSLIIKENVNMLPIYLFLDDDAANETMKAATRIQSKTTVPVYIVVNKSGKDANDLGHEKCMELIDNAVLANEQGKLFVDLNNLL